MKWKHKSLLTEMIKQVDLFHHHQYHPYHIPNGKIFSECPVKKKDVCINGVY